MQGTKWPDGLVLSDETLCGTLLTTGLVVVAARSRGKAEFPLIGLQSSQILPCRSPTTLNSRNLPSHPGTASRSSLDQQKRVSSAGGEKDVITQLANAVSFP